MTADRPNHIRFQHGSTHFAETFGGLYSITPICLTGDGHTPHLEIRTQFGLRMDVTPSFFAALLRDGRKALDKLPLALRADDIHDAVGGE
jgi:hypothetical protein